MADGVKLDGPRLMDAAPELLVLLEVEGELPGLRQVVVLLPQVRAVFVHGPLHVLRHLCHRCIGNNKTHHGSPLDSSAGLNKIQSGPFGTKAIHRRNSSHGSQ